METSKIAALFVLSSSFLACPSWSRPVDLSAPSGQLGAANSKGLLEIWREVDGAGIQLGKSYLPFRYKFSSDPTTGGFLGPGFYVPLFEARNVLIRESTMRAYLPCGKGLYLWRDSVDPRKFQAVDQEWTGYLEDGGDFVVWRNDGWKILYHKNRLASIVTDDQHSFIWDYTQSGLPTGVSEDGRQIISVEQNAAGQVAAFDFTGKRYAVEYAERPITEMLMGQVAIKELDQALSSLKYPDGKSENFKFVLTPNLVPTVTFTSTDNEQTLYSWDATTSYIATEKGPEGDWTYKVGKITQDFGLPPLSRTSSEGKSEGVAVDTKIGTYTAQMADGTTTTTNVFETPGPLYHKVKSIDKTVDGKTSTVYKASYDEAGQLIRKMDDKGFITSFFYDQKGDIKSSTVSLSSDPSLLQKLKTKEQAAIMLVNNAVTVDDKQDAIRDLARFYLFEMNDPGKALSFVPKLNHSMAYALRVQSIDYNTSLSPTQKVLGYKELLKEYPENKADLDFLIETRELESKNENG